MIIKEFISNLAILVSVLFLYTQLTKGTPLSPSSSLRKKVFIGVMGGALGNILMVYSLTFGETLVDLRHIPLAIVAYYGGSIPAVLTGTLIMAGRLIIGVNLSSLVGVAMVAAMTLAVILIVSWNKQKKYNLLLSLTAFNLIFSATAMYLLNDYGVLLTLLPSYWVLSYIGGYTAYYLVEYERKHERLMTRYKEEASTDSLTGLNNVRKFDELFNVIISQVKEKREPLAFLYLDIDHFKKVNDTYGHSEGDVVLSELGTLLQNHVRSFDIVSRNGGEEFSVLLLDTTLEDGRKTGERIRDEVENHAFTLTNGRTIHITVSLGLAGYDETTADPHQLLKDADEALYHAKKTGRNRLCVFRSASEDAPIHEKHPI